MGYKKPVFITLGVTAILLVAIGAFVAVVDPYQQYHCRENAYCGTQRSEIAGVARNHLYDAFVTGSSMAMNHYPEQIDSLWGWRTKNFSIMGATFDDYAIILPFVIAQGKAKNVILDLDVFSFARERAAVPKYLYDGNVLTDYEYLYNYTSLSSAIGYLRHPVPEKGLYHFNSTVGFDALKENYRKAALNDSYESETYDFALMRERFDNSLRKVISDSGEGINWYVYFPPYSIAEFMLLYKYGDLDAYMQFKEYATSVLLQLPNVTLYDFQNAPWITNLHEYMDVRHHSHAYNKAIIQAIYDGDCRVDATCQNGKELLIGLIRQYRDSL